MDYQDHLVEKAREKMEGRAIDEGRFKIVLKSERDKKHRAPSGQKQCQDT